MLLFVSHFHLLYTLAIFSSLILPHASCVWLNTHLALRLFLSVSLLTIHSSNPINLPQHLFTCFICFLNNPITPIIHIYIWPLAPANNINITKVWVLLLIIIWVLLKKLYMACIYFCFHMFTYTLVLPLYVVPTIRWLKRQLRWCFVLI